MPLHWGRLRTRPTLEQRAENARLKAEREKATMTCQCCGKRYLANTGKIAHHGYERPGQGWQTASCMGAKYLPFEVSRDRLLDMIGAIEALRNRTRAERTAIIDETKPITLTAPDYSKLPDALGKHPVLEIPVMRETFDKQRQKYLGAFLHKSWHDFDEVKAVRLRGLECQIADLDIEIAAMRKRWTDWKQTHEWNKETKSWKPNR